MTSPAPAPAGWTPRLLLSFLSILCIVESVGFSFVASSTALPSIIQHFQTTQGGWVLTAFALVGAASAPLFGKLGDLYGKRQALLIALGLAAAGDVLAAVAPELWMLVLGQVLHGCVAATLFLGYSLMRDVYPEKIVPFAASVSITGAGVLSIGAPFLIGALIDRYGFRSVYVFDLAWIVVMGLILLLTTPESSLRSRAKIDLTGTVLIAVGLAALLLGISKGSAWGWSSGRVVGLLVAGAVLLVVYILFSLRVAEPVLNLRAVVRPAILFAVLCGGVAYGLSPMNQTLMALLAMTPHELGGSYGLGMTASQYALLTAPLSLFSVCAGIAVGVLTRRIGARVPMCVGLALYGVGALYLMFQHAVFWQLLVGSVVLGTATGLCLAAMPNLIIASAPASEQASMASAGELSAGLIGAITPIVAFAIMTPGAKSPAPGVLIYSNAGITTSFLVSACIAAATLLIGAMLLRARNGRPDATLEPVPSEQDVLPA